MKPNRLIMLLMSMMTLSAHAAKVTVSMNAVSKTMTLTNKATGENVDVGTPSGTTYKFTADAGDYVLTAYATNGTTVNGTMDITVSDEAEQTFKVFTLTAYASNSGWTLGKDYTIETSITTRDGAVRTTVSGKSTTSGRITVVVLEGDTYLFNFVPSAARAAAGYLTGTRQGTVNFNVTASMAIPMSLDYSITVPQEAELFLGTKTAHFKSFDSVMPVSIANEGNNKVYTYKLADSQVYNYRTWTASGLTYAGHFTASTDAAKMPQLQFSTDDYTAHIPMEVRRDNLAQTGDIMLNINERGHLSMHTGDTYDVLAMRSWQATDNITANYFIEPRFHYTVINEQGQPDNSVVTFDTYTTNADPWVSMKAVGSGTAIVMVTYEAMNLTYYSGATAASFTNGPFFGAIWPENTGVYVVTVDNGNSSVVPNMTIQPGKDHAQRNAGQFVDAEHDVFYYLNTEAGALYTFTPQNVSSVQLSAPVIDDMGVSYSGFSSAGVTANTNGSYTLLLKEGRNIVKLTDANGHSIYQVLTAKPVKVDIVNTSLPGTKIYQPGDKVEVQFATLYHPASKLAGIYNMSATMGYTSPSVKGAANQYAFASTPASQKVAFTIPADTEQPTLTLEDGYLMAGGFGDPYGNHRLVSRTTGRNPNFTAQSRTAYFGQLPDITIPLTKASVALTVNTNAENVSLTITDENGTELTANSEGVYTVKYGHYGYVATAEGYKRAIGTIAVEPDCGNQLTASITLESAPANGWDGTTLTAPQLSDGLYLISSGAELAWFANEVTVNKKYTIQAKLVSDIDLCNFPWTPIGKNSTSTAFKGTFDGNGHTVSGLIINSTSTYQGFFGYTSAATIKGLTVEGNIKTSANYAAGIAAYAASGTSITDCVNRVTVEGKQYAGGITAYANNASIERCANEADITGSSSYVAGITPYITNASSKVLNCFNSATITGTGNVATLVANVQTAAIEVKNNLNVGQLSCSATTTGNVYSGTASRTAISDNYVVQHYSNGKNYETVVNDDQLRNGSVALLLGDAFGQELGKDSYPVLGGKKVYLTDNGPTNISDYTLAVLTFEDSDYKGDANFAGKMDWSSLIDDNQYSGSLLYGEDGYGYFSAEDAYRWTDANNTWLSHTISEGYGNWTYWSGGHAISNYGSGDIETYGDFNSQLTVYHNGVNGLTRSGNGHNGSDNFAVHYGYADDSGFGLGEESLPSFSFADGKARTIDHMFVNNTNYTLNCFLDGNGLTAKIGDNDWAKVVATGYNGTDKTGTAELYLCNGPQDILMDWTKFDLSPLGNVTKVVFNIVGSSDNGYGYSQPAYFAYDDVAVRVPALNILFYQGTASVFSEETINTEQVQEIASKLEGKAFSTLDLTNVTLADNIKADNISALLSGNALALLPDASSLQGRNLIADGLCSRLVLTDKADFTPPTNFTATEAVYAKTGLDASGWYSCVLPYDFTLPEGVSAISNATLEDNAILFDEVKGTVAANTPFLYKLDSDGSISFTATDAEVKAVGKPASGQLLGTYTLIPAGEATGKLILNSDGTAFATASATASIPAFRAYLDNAGGAGSNAYTIVIDGEVTGLATVSTDGTFCTASVNVYSTDGKLLRSNVDSAKALQGLDKGIYIVNGKKIMKQ